MEDAQRHMFGQQRAQAVGCAVVLFCAGACGSKVGNVAAGPVDGPNTASEASGDTQRGSVMVAESSAAGAAGGAQGPNGASATGVGTTAGAGWSAASAGGRPGV